MSHLLKACKVDQHETHHCIILHSIGPLDTPQTVASELHFHFCVTYRLPILETTVISAPEPENDARVNIEQRPDNQGAAAPSAALSEVAENVFNEILCPTDDLMAGDPNVAHPTLEYFVKDVLAIPPQARGELVEDTAEDPGEESRCYFPMLFLFVSFFNEDT